MSGRILARDVFIAFSTLAVVSVSALTMLKGIVPVILEGVVHTTAVMAVFIAVISAIGYTLAWQLDRARRDSGLSNQETPQLAGWGKLRDFSLKAGVVLTGVSLLSLLSTWLVQKPAAQTDQSLYSAVRVLSVILLNVGLPFGVMSLVFFCVMWRLDRCTGSVPRDSAVW